MIVIDASAMVAVLLQEEGYEAITAKLGAADGIFASPVNLWEAGVIAQRIGAGSELFTAWLSAHRIEVSEDVSWEAALDAFRRFGKGRHPARLNLGDCFAYALAKSLDAPLLFKGNDFARTDIRSVL